VALIGILHYTLPPEEGGVENLIRSQADALTRAGHTVRLIAGAGEAEAGQELVVLPHMLPGHPEVRSALTEVHGTPSADHWLVRSLGFNLQRAIAGCDAIWVHNILTLNLHPFLYLAVLDLISRGHAERWSLWCEDLSAASRFTKGGAQAPLASLRDRGAAVVTISEHRARQISTIFGLPRSDIQVIAPPVAPDWFGIEAGGFETARRVGALLADPLVLVPSKLLAHKGLAICPPLAAALRRTFQSSLVLITGAASPHEPAASGAMLQALKAEASPLASGAFGIASDILGAELGARTVHDLMVLADVVFLPSQEEGYGLPIAEACAAGTAVICSDIEAFREAGGGWATFVRPGATAGEIAQQIEGICARPETRARRRVVRSSHSFAEQLRQVCPL
jgi:mannosylglucosylglycerate synthase